MDLKRRIIDLAQSLGFQRTVIASLEPMHQSAKRFQDWVDRGFAGQMNYLKRDPKARNTPNLLAPFARSAIVVSVGYYTPKPPPPGPFFGSIASYAVGLDYHAVLRRKLRELKEALEKEIGRPLLGRAFTDDVQLNERSLAARHGLGFAGRNTLIIGPKLLGSYNFIGELLTDLELEPDEKYVGTCGKCFRCGVQCPTDAILPEGQLDSNLCISYLTIENKDGIPLGLRSKLGKWVFGCDICQVVCPYNQRPPHTEWPEFRPEAGAGHYLDLLPLLRIKDEQDFLAHFQHTALRRPKRRGLLRNALVVLGNCLRETVAPAPSAGRETTFPRSEVNTPSVPEVIKEIKAFASCETDNMLKEHAQWAIEQA
jgi:epoxyqueuosine reductase